jgi:DMSO/TMAO reductase YedYZ molybdopterin-dependent catalytic subunit
LDDAGTISFFGSKKSDVQDSKPRKITYRNLPAIIFILFLTVGTIYYTTSVASVFADPNTCEVKGLVNNPYSFTLTDFAGYETTIEAELIGAYTHLPPANYTGPLLSTILERANVQEEATGVQIIARDGYSISLDLSVVMTDSHLLLTLSDDGFWLIAGNYDGSMWVRQVIVLQVY